MPYVIGAPIDLADFLALPPDGNAYARDERGRLALMSPEDATHHAIPQSNLTHRLVEGVARGHRVFPRPSIALPKIFDLDGNLQRESFLGPKTLEPDLACYAHRPAVKVGPGGATFLLPAGLLLGVEILSAGTWKSDLGIGEGDQVDKKRSYLESGVPEYWVVNAGVRRRACPVPVRSVRAWTSIGRGKSRRWEEIPIEAEVLRSRSMPGVEIDLASYWDDCGL